MGLKTFGPTDSLGIVLEQMGSQTGYVSPLLIVHGVDAVGNEKTGILDLKFLPEMTYEAKLQQTAEIGTYAATLEPYFTHLTELYFVIKSILDLRSLGQKAEEEVFLISHVEVATHAFTTKVFTLMYDTSGIKGVKCVATEAEPFGVDTAQPYQLLKTFMKRYTEAKPKKTTN